MRAMIRINLIGSKKGRRRGRGGLPDIPNVGVLLFVLLLVIEGAVLYSWRASAVENVANLRQKLNLHNHELKTLQDISTQMDQIKKEILDLKKNTDLFDELAANKRGPVDALTYLAFILHDRDEATHPSAEIRAMEAAGWRMNWQANRAWFTLIRETHGEVTLKGQAIDHEDVAEVQRRLESSPYFREVHLLFQEIRHRDNVNMNYVEFTIKASLIYLIKPLNKAAKANAEEEKDAALDNVAKKSSTLRMPSTLSVPSDRSALDASPLPNDVTNDQGLAAEADSEQAPIKTEGPKTLEKIDMPSLNDLLEAR